MSSIINRVVVAIINLIILLFTSPTLPSADARNVQDASGKRVINGGKYYIRTYNPGPYDYTPITWAYNASTSTYLNCPLYVTQNSNANITAIISSSMTMSKHIPLGIYITITFVDNNIPCNISQSWSAMPAFDSKFNGFYVGVGYALPSYDEGAFQILDAKLKYQKNVYKLRYCTEDEGCMDVGWLDDGSGSPYLAMTMDSKVGLDTFYFILE